METMQSVVVALLMVVTLLAGAYWAYQEGYTDAMIEKIGYVLT